MGSLIFSVSVSIGFVLQDVWLGEDRQHPTTRSSTKPIIIGMDFK